MRLALVAALLTACSSAPGGSPTTGPSSSTVSVIEPTADDVRAAAPILDHGRAADLVRPAARDSACRAAATTILGHYRVVAYYGGPARPSSACSARAAPEDIADDIEARAGDCAQYG